MRLLATFAILLLPLGVVACSNGGPYTEACSDLCHTLAIDCELPGYEAYARKVRYRLLPGVW